MHTRIDLTHSEDVHVVHSAIDGDRFELRLSDEPGGAVFVHGETYEPEPAGLELVLTPDQVRQLSYVLTQANELFATKPWENR
jgi:hypothetical protein